MALAYDTFDAENRAGDSKEFLKSNNPMTPPLFSDRCNTTGQNGYSGIADLSYFLLGA